MHTAVTVYAEPLTADDWEILVSSTLQSTICRLSLAQRLRKQELHATHVEHSMLSQARVARVGQPLAIWVHGHNLVRLQIGAFPVPYP
jgi:hypothetical protein